jgi:phage terminase Nu1 subunit (DNA packaging protein)
MKEIKPLTQGQCAGLLGITTRTFRGWLANGKGPERKADGTIGISDFKEYLEEKLGASVQRDPETGEIYDYQEERARLTKNQADEKELIVAELQGDMVRVSVIEKEWTEAVMAMRSKLLALPVRLAAKAVGMDSIREIEDYAREEIYAALFEVQPDHADTRSDEGESGDTPGNSETEATAETYGIRVG